MRRRYNSHLPELLLSSLVALLLPLPSLAANATCPYDIDTASRMIPPACYANVTSPSATSCCWFVFAAYIYAAASYANHTGAAFLPNPAASACSDAFSATLISRGLVHPSLLLSNDTCSLSGSPVPLAAGNRPCQFSTVTAVRSAVDLSNATLLCVSPAVDLSPGQSSCVSCQTAVTAAVYDLFVVTGSKEFVSCGMAATIAIWSSTSPRLNKFRSYALCMVQVLENVGNLGTGGLIPSPPPPPTSVPPPPPAGDGGSSRSVKIAAGSASAGVASIAAIVCLVLAMRKRRKRSTQVNGVRDPTVATRSWLLPTEGLYIFTEAELKQATNAYDERLLLGEGGAGKVYLGKLPSGQHVAIKRIYRETKLCEFYGEVEILAKLRHRNLTTMVGYCLGEREHVLVYEYMAGGNLASALHGGELAWRRRVRIAVDVAEGLAYLHEFPEGAVVHRDVKPTNVLLSADAASAKLSDFGVSRIMPSEATHLSTEVRGTMGYVDPDSFSVGHVSEAADVYSFGVVLLELVTGMRAVVPTPSGGAESIVHAARGAMAAAAAAGDASLGSVVDRRLGPGWDRPSVGVVFETACRCVRPYKEERPTMGEVLGVLKRVLVDLESGMGGAASSPLSTEHVSEEFSASSTSQTIGSTPSIHAWSL